MNKILDKKVTIKFIYPVITENILAIILSLLASMLIGKISGSSLTIVGISNTAFTIGICAFAMLTNTPAILTARLIGADDNEQASEIIEQSIFYSLAGSLILTVFIELFSSNIVEILTPNADSIFVAETVSFFRIFGLSFPFMLLYNVLAGILRSAGNSVIPMLSGILMNLLHFIFTFILAYGFRLGMTGVGISYTVCRFIGMVILLIAVLRSDYNFRVDIKRILKPKYAVFKRIFKIGLPISIESTLVQAGYLAANVISVSLGIQNAAAYQVANTINMFLALPQGICNALALVIAGQLIGAREYKKAKQSVWIILFAGLAVTAVIGLPSAAGGKFISSFFSADIAVITEGARLLWILLLVDIPSVCINVLDPVLRTGGDPKFVMISSILGVWLVRIPLTFLFCYRLNMGVSGIFLANFIGLSFRTVRNAIRFQTGKWLRTVI